MKALTIQNPWVFAITDLGKNVENRTWKPPLSIIGQRIALHVSKKYGHDANDAIRRITGRSTVVIDKSHAGMIVATAVVVGWVDNQGRYSNINIKSRVDPKWFFGPVGWVLDYVKKVEPVLCKGALLLWDVPASISESLL